MTAALNPRRYRAHDSVVAEELDGETVLLSMDSGIYFGLDALGTCIWRGLTAGRDLTEVVTQLAQRYSTTPSLTIASDAEQLLTELTRHGLLTVANNA